eukprot:g23627.t1
MKNIELFLPVTDMSEHWQSARVRAEVDVLWDLLFPLRLSFYTSKNKKQTSEVQPPKFLPGNKPLDAEGQEQVWKRKDGSKAKVRLLTLNKDRRRVIFSVCELQDGHDADMQAVHSIALSKLGPGLTFVEWFVHAVRLPAGATAAAKSTQSWTQLNADLFRQARCYLQEMARHAQYDKVQNKNKKKKKYGAFAPLDADKDLERLNVISSMCMNCHRTGETRLMLTNIPYFRDIIVSSFDCPHCNFAESEIKPANSLQAKGCRYEIAIKSKAEAPDAAHRDLNRQVIRGEWCTVLVPHIDFEAPGRGQKAEITTVEGLLSSFADGLEATYVQSKQENVSSEQVSQIQAIVNDMRQCSTAEKAFKLVLDDPSGNSFLENPNAPLLDFPEVKTQFYNRTKEQVETMGWSWEDEQSSFAAENKGATARVELSEDIKRKVEERLEQLHEKTAELPGICHSCHKENLTRFATTEIPHFKEILIFCTSCDNCGYRNTEVKPGGGVAAKGLKITLKVLSKDDLKRDLLKSDSAGVSIPELELELIHGTL